MAVLYDAGLERRERMNGYELESVRGTVARRQALTKVITENRDAKERGMKFATMYLTQAQLEEALDYLNNSGIKVVRIAGDDRLGSSERMKSLIHIGSQDARYLTWEVY